MRAYNRLLCRSLSFDVSTVWSGETKLIVIIETTQSTPYTKRTARRSAAVRRLQLFGSLAQWGKKQLLADQCFLKRNRTKNNI